MCSFLTQEALEAMFLWPIQRDQHRKEARTERSLFQYVRYYQNMVIKFLVAQLTWSAIARRRICTGMGHRRERDLNGRLWRRQESLIHRGMHRVHLDMK